jgi:hypothetical protein
MAKRGFLCMERLRYYESIQKMSILGYRIPITNKQRFAMPTVYKHPHVRHVADMYGVVLGSAPRFATVQEQLSHFAKCLQSAYQSGFQAWLVEINNWHPALASLDHSLKLEFPFRMADFELVLARQYGFESWERMMAMPPLLFDRHFELAVDLLLLGDMERLGHLLDARPYLTKTSSPYGHQAALVHYLAANGVETWRQVVPSNAPDMARLLLSRGCDPNMPSNIYGGTYGLRALIESSAHPHEAGITAPLLTALGV